MPAVRKPAHLLLCLLATGLSGCLGAGKWVAPEPASLELDRTALSGRQESPMPSVSLAPPGFDPAPRISEIPLRKKARFCCAFGTDLRVRLGALPLPWVKVGRFLDLEELGPHRYDGATAAVDDTRENAFPGGEHNGMMYTCRGGFIDTAHVRETVDWAAYFVGELDHHLETGVVLDLGDEGGDRTMVIEAVPPEVIAEYGRDRVIIDMAQWMSYQIMNWHEIAQWYGWSIVPIYPEKVSGFSPEDIYSNAVGMKLIADVDIDRSLRSEKAYNRFVDRQITEELARLQPVPKDLAVDAVRAVDKVWWDSDLRLPEDELVQRRYLHMGNRLEPWVVPDQLASAELTEDLEQACGAAPEPEVIQVPDRLGDYEFTHHISFEIVPEPRVARNDVFRLLGARISHRDFPQLENAVREQNRAEFGQRQLPQRVPVLLLRRRELEVQHGQHPSAGAAAAAPSISAR